MKILLTGASGFLGRSVAKELCFYDDFSVALALRSSRELMGLPVFTVGDLSESINWGDALLGRDVVIHAAARAHSMISTGQEALAYYRQVNVIATLNLARQAASARVKRFIFISSIKVNGESTEFGAPFRESDQAQPSDAYGISKLEAEQGLLALAGETGMEVVIIRPSLIYGVGVRGNFSKLIKISALGLPLPLGAIKNARSLIAIDNLVDLIILCVKHPAAANQVFLAADGDDLSTTELLMGLAEAMGRRAHLFPFPVWLLKSMAAVLQKQAISSRLFDSLQVDISKARALLGWKPRISVKEGLKRCVCDSCL